MPTEFPLSMYPLLEIVMELNVVRSGKSLSVTRWMASAGNTRSSPGTGATPRPSSPPWSKSVSEEADPRLLVARAGAGVRPTTVSASSTPRMTGRPGPAPALLADGE